MKFCQNVPHMLKVKKFRVSADLRLDSIKENIEGDANLHHTPPPLIGLSEAFLSQKLQLHFTKNTKLCNFSYFFYV